ncbi:hypothetical protein O181_012350 [Austropuccinia psidii MF-1]|uniref:Uncharacterized protein n=1 Tax=Austropuccinia psidii MF-1 TaxID=1389203 RepID=A0A9Q3BXU0_9BASI|nr:hypothetical protein [Austropuccinia psidii MF-1]
MSPVHLRSLGFQRSRPEDREGLSRTRRPEGQHLEHSRGWLEIEGNHTHSAINLPIQQKPQTRGLEGYGSSSSAPPTPQRAFSVECRQQEVQTGIPPGKTWSKFPEDMSQRDRLQRPYCNHQRLESHQAVQTPRDSFQLTRSGPNQLSSGFTPFRNQKISSKESPFFTIPGSFQEKTRIQVQKKDLFQPKEERVRTNDPEALGLGERSTQVPEIAVQTSRISSPINRNITPTQIEHNVVKPESNLNSDALWLKMSQFSEQTQKQFAELQASHAMMKTLTASMDKIFKSLQERPAQLSRASEETNKILNQVFEEQKHSKRDRDCLEQDINKLLKVYHNLKSQPQDHVMDNPYHQEDIKMDATLGKKARSPSQYQDTDNMSYYEKEASKQPPDASNWPEFSGREDMIIWS